MEQKQLIRSRIVDTREPWELREKLIETGWEQSYLKSGDFYFQTYDYKRVGVTRKSVQDMVSSIGDRFSHQLEEMLDFYDICILLTEGSWKRVGVDRIQTGRGMEHYTWDIVWDYVHRWLAKGFILELTTSMGHTAHRLNKLYALYQKPYSLSARSRQFTDDRVMAMPSGCRGKTGQLILEGRSLKEVCSMSIEQYLSIDGIGKKRAESLFNHFNRRSNSND